MLTRTIHGPMGIFVIPGEPETRSQHSETCVRHVFGGEYNYERPEVEDVRTIVDVGCNVGAFIVWACGEWWRGRIEEVYAYDPNEKAVTLAAINTIDCPCTFLPYAVTSQSAPVFFKEYDDWGGSRTYGEKSGVEVPSLLPQQLPPADVLKVDAEGVDAEVFMGYQHGDRVKVAMFEYHQPLDAPIIQRVCVGWGLRQVRHHGSPPNQGIQIWVRDPEGRYAFTQR